ncbi:MAG TPA: SRPBCC family protein [Acidimicrobiaceae bacterium]|nr:SRPBCC family protein [Acidimicrobiaceae bacterium]
MADRPDAVGGGRLGYELVGHTAAPPEVVWPLVAEVEHWKEWSFLTHTFLRQPGAPDPNGVGAVRRLAVGPFGSTEEVVAFEPPRHLGYVARRGMPARHYRADVVLDPEGSGTRITWSGTMDPLVPGSGPLALAYARSFVRRFLSGLTRYADRRADGSPSTPG